MTTVRRFCCDDETGEVVTYTVNEETGEPCYAGPPEPSLKHGHHKRPKNAVNLPVGCGYDGEKFKSLKEDIMAGSNLVSHRMLLIPTVVFFPGLCCIILMILEIYLHVWCHKKNKLLKDPTVYYRSPFHIVTSNFCGVCRDSNSCWKVGQLQDQRRDRYSYLQGIVL